MPISRLDLRLADTAALQRAACGARFVAEVEP
jgi:hypothetical protein